MKHWVYILICLSITAQINAAHAEVLPIPAEGSSGAVFLPQPSNVYIAGGDRALAVVDQSLVVVGAKGARLTALPNTNASLLGRVIVHAGPRPVLLHIGEMTLELTASTIVVDANRSGAFVLVHSRGEDGCVRALYPNSTDGRTLLPNAPYRLTAKGPILAPDRRETLERIFANLTTRKKEARLALEDPAVPEDYRLGESLRRNRDTAEIEIEAVEIEIEPGCIEVCQD